MLTDIQKEQFKFVKDYCKERGVRVHEDAKKGETVKIFPEYYDI